MQKLTLLSPFDKGNIITFKNSENNSDSNNNSSNDSGSNNNNDNDGNIEGNSVKMSRTQDQ